MRLLPVIGLFLLSIFPAHAKPDPEGDPIEIMVIGSWHFKTSGADVINVDGPNVLTPEHQKELEEVTDRLMAFRPTLVALEQETDAPGYVIEKYTDYSPAMLTEIPNERVQIGYRLAAAAGLSSVYGIDEQPSEGEPDYFPFNALMEHIGAIGEMEAFQEKLAGVQEMVAAEMEELSALPIADALVRANEGMLSSPEFYYALATYDEGETQPAAELQAYWFMRNAKIFSKLLDVAEPGDRVVVVYGAGHKFWLDHLASHTPGVELVDPLPYLKGEGGE